MRVASKLSSKETLPLAAGVLAAQHTSPGIRVRRGGVQDIVADSLHGPLSLKDSKTKRLRREDPKHSRALASLEKKNQVTSPTPKTNSNKIPSLKNANGDATECHTASFAACLSCKQHAQPRLQQSRLQLLCVGPPPLVTTANPVYAKRFR
jgi:hypothetical protein